MQRHLTPARKAVHACAMMAHDRNISCCCCGSWQAVLRLLLLRQQAVQLAGCAPDPCLLHPQVLTRRWVGAMWSGDAKMLFTSLIEWAYDLQQASPHCSPRHARTAKHVLPDGSNACESRRAAIRVT
jgi:hypothetical protein